MKTINSISGGKTSAFMAYHYPADYNVFSLVTINDINSKPKDKLLIKIISDKIGKEFISTAEDIKTLLAVLELEQLISKEIIWLSGESFDDVINKKKALPNVMWRFCTTELKLIPIFNWWKNNFDEQIKMRIGFRFDEIERSKNFTNSIKTVVGKTKNGKKNKWGTINWRIGEFPLIENKILHYHVKNWVNTTNLIFPDDSNCVGCFWKPLQQLRKNWQENPQKMQWFSSQEKKINKTFKKEISYDKIKNIGIQNDFIFGTGSGCQAGFCTD
jgi:hypothetical protein